jgi:succinoglycan biosynthesis protein ExoV
MKLVYHKGQNFGDALNPYILDQLFPDFFDENKKEVFLGIGSIIGLKQHYEQKKIVFSSGYAAGNTSTYGVIPLIDNSWDIRCVRGPLTAKTLNIDQKLAVADGAILLNAVYNKTSLKKYKYSYIPHHSSLNMYTQWADLLGACDIHLIDPTADFNEVLTAINSSEFIITEAMHGAIVADALRVPWFGVKAYPYINDFKWNDWAASLDIVVSLTPLPSVHEHDFFRKVILNKSKSLIPNFALDKATDYIVKKRENSFIKQLKTIKESKFSLSNESVLKSKCDQLCDIAQKTITKYQ